jgi:hypothetical protein
MATINYDLGITDMEPDTEQQEIISERVQEVIASLREMIRLSRENLSKPTEKAKLHLISGDFVKHVQETLLHEKHLQLIYEEMSVRTPGYKNVDIAIMATMLRYAPDFFIATISGNKNAINREKRRFITDLVNKNRKPERLEMGQEPTINTCEHVNDLNIIRKVKNDDERFALLVKFIGRYKGGQEDNWVSSYIQKNLMLFKK